jgi:radical SAM-linked protein
VKVQRLRVTFARDEALKYITHLDMMRFWERALRRAGVPVFYSEGFSPHAQIALAAPLAVGVTSECELMDVFLDQHMTPLDFSDRVSTQIPPAIRILKVHEAGLGLPSLQAEVRAAEYEVDVEPAAGAAEEELDAAIRNLLDAETFPWEHKREDEVRSYDLRTLVQEIDVVARDGGRARLRMLLRNDNTGSGRPEQVALALGLGTPTRIHRTKLILSERSPAMAAYRARGRFSE